MMTLVAVFLQPQAVSTLTFFSRYPIINTVITVITVFVISITHHKSGPWDSWGEPCVLGCQIYLKVISNTFLMFPQIENFTKLAGDQKDNDSNQGINEDMVKIHGSREDKKKSRAPTAMLPVGSSSLARNNPMMRLMKKLS